MLKFNINIDPEATRQRLRQHVLTYQKKLAFDVLEGIVVMTPVDTGRAKGNWFVTLVAPAVEYDWAKRDPGGGVTISEGSTRIQALSAYGAIYITNNLPYIVPLEKGHSRQSPAGMVRLTLDRVTAGLR